MLGRAAVAMWWQIEPAMRAEFEDWHTHEHMAERLGIPGFLRGTRWVALSGEPSYFILYEAARLATLTTGAYLERLNNPTAWSRKLMPHHLNMVRSLCRVRANAGAGYGAALATLRFSPSQNAVRWLAKEALPALAQRRGLAAACLLQSQPLPAAQTAEQKIRGRDRSADWILLASGYDAHPVADAARELREALRTRGAACEPAMPLYGPAYSLIASDLPRERPRRPARP